VGVLAVLAASAYIAVGWARAPSSPHVSAGTVRMSALLRSHREKEKRESVVFVEGPDQDR
jgi:hypothetical protein